MRGTDSYLHADNLLRAWNQSPVWACAYCGKPLHDPPRVGDGFGRPYCDLACSAAHSLQLLEEAGIEYVR
jgi:hypothetical protein